VAFADPDTVRIGPSWLHGWSGRIEGDYSNAAFLEAFRRTGSELSIGNLSPQSLQGDRVYAAYFDAIEAGVPTLDLSDCPDLGPVLFALAALKNGATFTGTDRLRIKEIDRGQAMGDELSKLGGELSIGENRITVSKKPLRYGGIPLSGHNDHRIVMALSVILAQTGGTVEGAEAVKKSYPCFFEEIIALGAKVTLS
jgi:3-phosphoshikimate 1-carboxyvinyltransferase